MSLKRSLFLLFFINQTMQPAALQQPPTPPTLPAGHPIIYVTVNVGGSRTEVDLNNETQVGIKARTDNKSDNKSDGKGSGNGGGATAPTNANLSQGQAAQAQAGASITKNPQPPTPHPAPQPTSSSSFRSYLKYGLWGIAGTAACAYAIHTVVLYKTTRILKRKKSWCNWKHEVPAQEFWETPREALSRELLSTIQQRHHNPRNPADHVYPVTHFLDAVKYEMTVLQAFTDLVRLEQKLRLSRVLKDRDLGPLVAQRLKKLGYLKELFFEWAREHRTRRSFTVHK